MEEMWANLEHCVGYKVPASLKYMLWKCGYDCEISVKQISEKRIEELEKFIQKNRNEILSNEGLGDDMCIYKKQRIFEFLPGHKTILLDLPESIKKMQSENTLENTFFHDDATDDVNKYSVILSALIKSANRNQNKPKNAFHYDDTIRYFSTYIFLMCGRTCYETLTKNLPIPSTKTVCKNIFSY